MKFKKGQEVIVSYLMDSKGKIVTEPVKIRNSICYGIVFDNPIHNKLFLPYYISEDCIERI